MDREDAFRLEAPKEYIDVLDDPEAVYELTESNFEDDTTVTIDEIQDSVVIHTFDMMSEREPFDLTPTPDSKIPHDDSQEVPSSFFDELPQPGPQPLPVIHWSSEEIPEPKGVHRDETWNPEAETGDGLSKAA
jgi:hypothetical protein